MTRRAERLAAGRRLKQKNRKGNNLAAASGAAWKSRGFSLAAVHEEMYLFTGAQVGDRGPLDGGGEQREAREARRAGPGRAGGAGMCVVPGCRLLHQTGIMSTVHIPPVLPSVFTAHRRPSKYTPLEKPFEEEIPLLSHSTC